jgi:hypothetical protein
MIRRRAARMAGTSWNAASSRSVIAVGGSSASLPSSAAAIASAGRSQAAWSASPVPPAASWPAGSAAVKNLVS